MHRRAISALSLVLFATLGHAQEQIRDVIYQKQGGVALTMDVFKPAKPNGIGVLFMVSGGWASNHDQITPLLAKPMTDKGITVFEVVHGSAPRYTITDILPQIQRAVRFVRTNAATYGVDPKKIGIYGASSGGHLSLMTAGRADAGKPDAKDPVERASSEVEAVGAFFPPTDFQNFGGPGVKAFSIPALMMFAPAFGVTKDTPTDQLEKLSYLLSPITYVTPKFPPTYIIQGDKDTLVPEQQAHLFDDALGKVNVPHTLVIAKGEGHNPLLLFSPYASKLADWFVATLNK